MKHIIQTAVAHKQLIVLGLVAVALFGASYAQGQWSNPGSNPPGGNVNTPVHTGIGNQVKSGDLTLADTYPQLGIIDTNTEHGSGEFRIINSNSRLHYQFNAGTLSSPSWTTLMFNNPAERPEGRYTRVVGEMRADQFCDENGQNCINPGQEASFTEVDPQVGTLNGGQWCRAKNDGTRILCDQSAPRLSCTKRSVTLDDSSYQTGEINRNAYCQSGEFVTGGSCYTGNTAVTIDYARTTANAWRCLKPAGHDADGFFRVTAVCCSVQ